VRIDFRHSFPCHCSGVVVLGTGIVFGPDGEDDDRLAATGLDQRIRRTGHREPVA
jgi:hypothetical protein